jgi:16S rRNA (uracil1498-N3)-methyltransferase
MMGIKIMNQSARSMATMQRLFVEETLSDGMTLSLDGNAAHYLAQVMRMAAGDNILLFDNKTGTWRGELIEVGKRRVMVTIAEHLKPREDVPDLWLCVAPIKKPRFDAIAEKACELGVARFIPVRTARSIVDKIKTDRLMATIIEAAEQCERNALPEIADLTTLATLLKDWPDGRHLFFCDERLHHNGAASMAAQLAAHTGPAGILIGPEGGFTGQEQAQIAAHPAAVPVSLGPRILRADTAAFAGVSLWMGTHGDWNDGC